MTARSDILFTGGSGLLGCELRKLFPESSFPSSREFDVTDPEQMRGFTETNGFEILVHAAAFTSPPRIDENPLQAIETNIVGTANVVKLCAARGARLVYLCTDYVFKGDLGNYAEDDPVHPVNKYAWSKLGGECAVRLYDESLTIRTTFGPNTFPYDKAFVDSWTSRESVSVIAQKIAPLITSDITGVIHVGGERRTVYEFAKSQDETKEIGELSIDDVDFDVPVDASLDCERYRQLVGRPELES